MAKHKIGLRFISLILVSLLLSLLMGFTIIAGAETNGAKPKILDVTFIPSDIEYNQWTDGQLTMFKVGTIKVTVQNVGKDFTNDKINVYIKNDKFRYSPWTHIVSEDYFERVQPNEVKTFVYEVELYGNDPSMSGQIISANPTIVARNNINRDSQSIAYYEDSKVLGVTFKVPVIQKSPGVQTIFVIGIIIVTFFILRNRK